MHNVPVVILVMLASLVVVVSLLLFRRRAERARTEAVQQAGAGAAFGFEPTADVDQMKALADLPVFNRGHGKRAYNVLSGRAGGNDVKIFDYRYTTGGGQHSHTWNQTIAFYPRAGHGLPDFVLSPEKMVHKIGQAFGYQDIDFESNPQFSSQYLLRGSDETAIRSAFSIEALGFLAQTPGWTVEVQAGTVGIYRAGKRSKPEELTTFLEESRAVLRALTRR